MYSPLKILKFPLDPVGTKSPKIPVKDTLTKAEAYLSHQSSLTCQAQGFPVPKFRSSRNKISKNSSERNFD
ncbi:hypothetical protein O3M35_007641 [Rhynocoris fuscipes]|uniref:Uncharacterized protein n=1 Tax=Rhynocoris fuscipes TaxID=488301 RepID=A0AAW1DBP6_9HEMI